MREGYSSRPVCVSVKSHLTSGASVHPENAVTGSVGEVGWAGKVSFMPISLSCM